MCQACEDRMSAVTEPEKRALLSRVDEASTDLAVALGEIPTDSPEGFLVAYSALRALAASLEVTFGPVALALGEELAARAAAERLAQAGLLPAGAH